MFYVVLLIHGNDAWFQKFNSAVMWEDSSNNSNRFIVKIDSTVPESQK